MKKENLEYRMYGFVPYNISEIQKGIQFGHAVVEYGLQFNKTKKYQKWATKDKTFIILNGGTSLDMIKAISKLYENKITCAEFSEPDLNGMLSAACFLVDERVWDTKKYPDCVKEHDIDPWESYDIIYYDWVNSIGGKKNVWLREYLKQFRLA